MKLLFIGDIVSRLGRQTVTRVLPSIKKEHAIDFVIANAENLAGGRGASVDTLHEMMRSGIDYFTSGDHIFWGEDAEKILEDEGMRVLRPANFPDDVIGRGYYVLNVGGTKLGIISLVGKTFETPPVGATDIFRTADRILEEIGMNYPILIDVHSEFTSEKIAFANYVSDRVSVVVGTHTHVGTVDARIINSRTGFVSDVGMVGPYDSVIGVETDIIIAKQMYPYPQRFEWVKSGTAVFNSVFADISDEGVCVDFGRIDQVIP
ncbi:YmdB family metallophosphoesterase [candidate division WWE3 bacterium]|uniref:YmdB family metallophosphoesterase n=1 Tax=candidate division WWE3 bacterium TaxID=2053526 RepID=A0A955LUV1_UNCKA|nr:YmdB family metallophosphoesterase [candidate division WWE3 bacterium]